MWEGWSQVELEQRTKSAEMTGEPVWPSGKAVSRVTSVRIRFGSAFSSKVVVCGHCLVTLSLTINETLKWLALLPVLMQVVTV